MDLAKKNQLGDSQGHNVVPQYVDSKQLFPVKFTYVWCNRKVGVFFSQFLLIKSQCVTAKHRFFAGQTPHFWAKQRHDLSSVPNPGWVMINSGIILTNISFFFANPWAENPDEPISIKRRLNGVLNTAHFGRWPHQLLVAAGWWRIGWSLFDCFMLGGSGTKLRPLAIEAARIQVFQILAKTKSERGCQVSQVKNWI